LRYFNIFLNFDAEYFYVPIETNKIENVRTGENLPLNYRLNVLEYLSLYGLHIEANSSSDQSNEKAGEKFEKFVFNCIKDKKRLSPEKMQIAQGVKIYRNYDENLTITKLT